jgi:hypothetical protein
MKNEEQERKKQGNIMKKREHTMKHDEKRQKTMKNDEKERKNNENRLNIWKTTMKNDEK